MTPITDIFGLDITKRIQVEAQARLNGRARSCAYNSMRFLLKADQISTISENVSYFCATHATEEAVACVIASAKQHGYIEARNINPKDHIHKAVIAQFARMAALLVVKAKFALSVHAATNQLLYRAYPKPDSDPVFGVLGLSSFSFNHDEENPDGASAFDQFIEIFADEAEMARQIKTYAEYRNAVLYAQDEGVPSMTKQKLFGQLREHTLMSMGLIWAATDMTYHRRKEPIVLQLLSAISSVCSKVKKEKICEQCERRL